MPLLYVEEFTYDLPFYLGLREPVPTLTDWDSPELPLHDNDRKGCLAQASSAPDAAARLLAAPSQWPIWLCRTALDGGRPCGCGKAVS